jgi:magnesium transporter
MTESTKETKEGHDVASLFVKRFNAPGSQPGVLIEGEEQGAKPRLTLTTYAPDSFDEREIESPDQVPDLKGEQVQWLGVEGHNVEVLRALGERFRVHPLVIEDIHHVGQRPKIEVFEDHLFITLDLFTLSESRDDVVKEQVNLLLFERRIISVLEGRERVFGPVRERLRKQHGRIRAEGADYIAYALIDTVVDHFFPLLEALGERISAIEDAVLEAPTQVHLARIHKLRRDLVRLRRSAWPLREMVTQLVRSNTAVVSESMEPFLRDVRDHTVQTLELIETYLEMTAGLTELYMSSLSNRMNEVMKVLTLISTIFIPLSFVAGVYGMNFDGDASPWNMPELRWYLGYPVVLTVMASMTAGLLLYFRHRRWL